MTTETLLIELGTEELPPKSLKTLATVFYQQIKAQIEVAELSYKEITWYATPRRLAVKVTELQACQQDKVIEKRGPAVSVAFDEQGQASKAAQGWARSNGITVEQAERLITEKGEWLLHKAVVTGAKVPELVPAMVETAINKLPIAKPMRWGAGKTEFIRPVHTLTLMFGDQVINGTALNITASNQVTGHRFHHQGLVEIDHGDNYETLMEQANVIVDYEKRKNVILAQINTEAEKLNGKALLDEDLLEEVTSIVEWPVVMVGSFEASFLDVPAEPLIYSMKDHQKYFPMTDQQGNLLNKFIFIANIDSKEPEQVIKGNEKVIRPRLADAEFFFKTDKKQSLASRLDKLSTVLFQKQLGTLKEKSERIASLSEYIAQQINEDCTAAHRAGLLSKTDLLSDMVLEFPQVQGTMGKYYAINDGEADNVAQALEDQYKPRFAGDSLPKDNIGSAVAIADKIDSLVGIFGINQPPKGDKDPFALRRAAIGLIRIIVEKQLPLDIKNLINKSTELYQDKINNAEVKSQVEDFVLGRYKAYYQDKAIASDVIQAVLNSAPTQPLDFDKRIKAVAHFKTLPQASTLAAANKRVGNILAKFNGELLAEFNNALANEAAEKALAACYNDMKARINPLMADKDYQQALTILAELKQPIDEFFDNVMVMVDDEAVKTNRLTLLSQIKASFFAIADIAVLQ